MPAPANFRATYRIQLRDGSGFSQIERHLPYLAALGVSHLYLSPIFAAAPGSTHGYDTVDFDVIEPSLGGRDGFESLSRAAQAHGLGILLDFVPNHMATAYENAWWRDVLEWGAAAQSAAVFDIDWTAPRLLLPILGETIEEALAANRFALEYRQDRICLVYGGALPLPLCPRSYDPLLARSGEAALTALASRFAGATPQSWKSDKATLGAAYREANISRALDRTLQDFARNPDALRALLEQQIWRLDHWHTARHALTYRRFFEIAGLIGVKVEHVPVFAAVHRSVLDLADKGLIHGLRIDHVDGLHDPEAYLMRLRRALPASFPVFVEKILGKGEELRQEWPIAGTTGYEFIGDVAGVLVDPGGEAPLDAFYREFTGWDEPYDEAVRRAKREILTRNLASELIYLEHAAAKIAGAPPRPRAREAIIAIAAELPVYRTYVSDGAISEEDRGIIAAAADAATRRAMASAPDIAAIAGFLCDTDDADACAFGGRFQQTTGALMAKAVEDTLFYRYNRLIALNEVGGDPEHFSSTPDAFHRSMQRRSLRNTQGLLTTATHDTKRGEDARARLYALSTCADAWKAAITRWSAQNAPLRTNGSRRIPSRNDEYLFYQALVGAWPLQAKDDTPSFAGLSERLAAFLQKAAREAKRETNWLSPNPSYENGLDAFVRGCLDLERSAPFLQDVGIFCRNIAAAGACNSLAQLTLKLTAPGIPDIYRGCESWDFSLVDPDNRRPFDMGAAAAMLEGVKTESTAALWTQWRDGAFKMRLLTGLLHARAENPQLFNGAYRPLTVEGRRAPYAIAFLRTSTMGALLTVVTIRAGAALAQDGIPRPDSQFWDDTRLLLDHRVVDFSWQDIVSRRAVQPSPALALKDVLADAPVAVLVGKPR